MKLKVNAVVAILYLCLHPAYPQIKAMEKINNYSVEIIRYNIGVDQRASFEDAYAKAAAILQKSPYCLGYEIIYGVDEPQHFIVRIHWTSKQDHMSGFRNSAEFGSFFNLVKPFYSNIEEMKHYEKTGIVWSRN